MGERCSVAEPVAGLPPVHRTRSLSVAMVIVSPGAMDASKSAKICRPRRTSPPMIAADQKQMAKSPIAARVVASRTSQPIDCDTEAGMSASKETMMNEPESENMAVVICAAATCEQSVAWSLFTVITRRPTACRPPWSMHASSTCTTATPLEARTSTSDITASTPFASTVKRSVVPAVLASMVGAVPS